MPESEEFPSQLKRSLLILLGVWAKTLHVPVHWNMGPFKEHSGGPFDIALCCPCNLTNNSNTFAPWATCLLCAYALTNRDEATTVMLLDGEELPIKCLLNICISTRSLQFLLLLCPTKREINVFLQWVEHYAHSLQKVVCWFSSLLSFYSTSGVPWWVSSIQENDWQNLSLFIKALQQWSAALEYVTRDNAISLPINKTLCSSEHGNPFPINAT